MTNFLKTLVVVSLFGASVGVKGASLVNGTLSPSGGGSSATLSPGQSNQVIVLINNNAPTNGGITAAQAATQIDSTNNAIIKPSINTKMNTNNGTSWNQILHSPTSANFVGDGSFSANFPTFIDDSFGLFTWKGTSPTIQQVNIAFSPGSLDFTSDGNVTSWTWDEAFSAASFSGVGSGLTSLNGANVQVNTINSNKLDAATRAMLGGGGGGSQTPLLSNVDAASNSLSSLATLGFIIQRDKQQWTLVDGSPYGSLLTSTTTNNGFLGTGGIQTEFGLFNNGVLVTNNGVASVITTNSITSPTITSPNFVGNGAGLTNVPGGGSSFPLSSSVSGGGHSITNLDSLQTSTLSYSYLSPFTNWTFVVCIGDSRGVTPSADTNWPTWLAQNVLVKVPYYAGLTNLCVSGQTLEQESNLWSSLYSTFTPGGGTNVLIIFSGGYNDPFFGTNSAQSVASQNYLFASARTNGDIVCGVAPWVGGAADGGTTYEQDFNPLQMNTRTNQNIDYRVDFGDTWDTVTANEYTSDGTHPNEMGIIKIAMYVWDALLQPAGYLGRMSEETHLPGFTRISMKSATHQDGGLSIAAQMMADFPGWELISLGGGGGRSIGIQIGSAWDIYTAPASGNFAQAFQFGTVSNVSSLPLYVPTITAPTNKAPHTLVSSAALHSLALNKGWTNDLGARADIILNVITTNSASAGPILAFTNAITGECYTNSSRPAVAGTNTFQIFYMDVSPGDFGSLSNYGTVGSVLIVNGNWKLK